MKEYKIYAADVEATGLLHQLVEQGNKSKLHNLCIMNIDDCNITTPVSLTDRSGLKYKILIGYQTLQDFGKSINLNNLTNNQ